MFCYVSKSTIAAAVLLKNLFSSVLAKEKSKSPSIYENNLSYSETQQKTSSSSPSNITSATSHSSSSEFPLHQYTNKLQSSVLDDNTSFFSSNSFQKLTATPPSQLKHNHIGEGGGQGDNDDNIVDTTEGESQPTSILTDTLPNINTTEDWAAAFGFPRPAEQISDVIGMFRV